MVPKSWERPVHLSLDRSDLNSHFTYWILCDIAVYCAIYGSVLHLHLLS